MIYSGVDVKFLINSLYEFVRLSGVQIQSETFENINIKIQGNPEVLNCLPKLYKAFSDIDNTKSVLSNSNEYEHENIGIDEINENIKASYFDFQWYISIDKNEWFKLEEQTVTAFFDKRNFVNCLQELNEFSPDNFFVNNSNIQIILPMYDGPDIIGSNFIITNTLKDKWVKKDNVITVGDSEIKEYIHVLSNEPVLFSPQKFSFSIKESSEEFEKILQMKYAQVLLVMIVQIFRSKDDVTLKGLKYFNKNLNNTNIIPDKHVVSILENAVKWVYEENTTTRLQLLIDRLSFYEFNVLSLMEIVINHIDEALVEAKDRYKFVITEKSEEYTKDLRDLLKDTKDKTDKYSEKTRSVINSLLRDTLGSIFFLGLTVYSRFSNQEKFIFSSDAHIIFTILGIYFLLSMLFQAIFNFWDIKLSKDESEIWSKSSMDYMTKETYSRYVTTPLSRRTSQFIKIQFGIITIYILLALCSFNAQNIIKYIS